MKRPRDSQRSRVYEAEHQAVKAMGTPYGKDVGLSKDEVQHWVDTVLMRRAVRKKFGDIKVTVTFRKGYRGQAWSVSRRIELGHGARHPWYILHELAHVLSDRRAASHGPEFCRTYLFLLEHVLGDDARRTLAVAYVANRVRIAGSSV